MKRLEDLRNELIGLQGNWSDIDNKILEILELGEEYGVFSSNPYDAMSFGHTYILDNDKQEGFNVEFEVIKDSFENTSEDRISDTFVEIVAVDWI